VAIPNYSKGAWVGRPEKRGSWLALQPQDDVRQCIVSPDGRLVITCSHGCLPDQCGCKVWDATDGTLIKELGLGPGGGAVFSPDGHWLGRLTNSGVRLWQVETWEEGPRLADRFAGLAFAPDSNLVAVGGEPGVVRLCVTETGRELARLEVPDATRLSPHFFSHDGSLLFAFGEEDRAIHVWDLRRVRAELVKLGLDWDAPAYPDAGPAQHSPLEVIVNLGPASRISAHTERANTHAEHARWDEAAAEYAALVQLQPDDHALWYRYACLCLQKGDVAGHRRCCAALLERFAGTANASIAHRVALACLLRPGAVSDLKLPTKLAERGVAGSPRDAWHLLTLGAAHFRAGRHAEAINRLREALEAARDHPNAYKYARVLSRLFLAMAYHSVGQAERAREWLDQAVDVIDFDFPRAGRVPLGDSWHDWIMSQVIRREAEALIGGQSKKQKK
jgi:Flp pilus assembly protein TadD